jgi:hypothetical protein
MKGPAPDSCPFLPYARPIAGRRAENIAAADDSGKHPKF